MRINKYYSLYAVLFVIGNAYGVMPPLERYADGMFKMSMRRDSLCVFRIARRYLPNDPIVLEAGAYKGKDTIRMKYCWPESDIHAFEPFGAAHDTALNRYKQKQLGGISLYKFALDTENGTRALYLSSVKKTGKFCGSSSLLQPKEHSIVEPGIVFEHATTVKTVTIDTWMKRFEIDHIDFAWLDLQGHELAVLQASPECVKNLKAVYMEVEFIEAYEGQPLYDDVKSWMEEHGFVTVARDFEESSLEPWFGNVLFVKKDLVENA